MATIPPNHQLFHHHHHHHVLLHADKMHSASISSSASISPQPAAAASGAVNSSSSNNSNKNATSGTSASSSMAVAPASKAKAAKADTNRPAAGPNGKQKNTTHRRSRTGCYTCRLRRKKCDEVTPMCSACNHLGLHCDYKRPMWWGNNDHRRKKKEEIKVIIKHKKLSEKASRPLAAPVTMNMNLALSAPMDPHMMSPPPLLSHSLPTSATFSDPLDRNRSASIDSAAGGMMPGGFVATGASFSPDFVNFGSNGFCSPDMFMQYPPYEVDVKTERQMFVNDVPTMRESTISTFSAFGTPHGGPMIGGEWDTPVFTETTNEFKTEETLNCNFFEFHPELNSAELNISLAPTTTTTSVAVEVELDENDQVLLDHFVQAVLPTIFPILDTNHPASPATDLILPALQSNKCYLHCCLAIAAQHLKATMQSTPNPELDQAVIHHRYETVSMLCKSLAADESHNEILDVLLALVFFQSVVGTVEDSLQDIPWHQHMTAAISVAQKLGLPSPVLDNMIVMPKEKPTNDTAAASGIATSAESSGPSSTITTTSPQPPFSMTLMSWIDILGATMKGSAPIFAHTYRNKHLSHPASSLGLRELMGCDDRVMYLISEIACLEALRAEGMEDITLCQHVHVLGDQITLTEKADGANNQLKSAYNAHGVLSPRQLSLNVTAAFRIAARIYLCSLVPGFSPAQASCMGLVEKLANVLQFIPSGYDRSLAWMYLIGGSVALPGSSFRAVFEERLANMGQQALIGSIGQVAMVLRAVWQTVDQVVAAQAAANSAAGTPAGTDVMPYIHWRDVMTARGWDLLIM